MADKLQITSPVGRLVAGSLYRVVDKNFDGQPLVYKTGPNVGKPRTEYYFAVAIPKTPGLTHWAYEEWGKQIWAIGHKEFPQAAQRPDFAWKIEDGDSTVPNKKNRRPCDSEGWPGNWILKLRGGFAPQIFEQQGQQFIQHTEENYIKPGYFIQVRFSVDGNGQQNNPGVYLNHQMVCFRAFGPEINFGPNVEDAGFGAAPLPPGASMVPLAGAMPPAAPSVAYPAPAAPPPHGAPVAYPAPAAAPAPPVGPITPNPGFLSPPAPSYASAAPASYPAPPGAPASPGAMTAPPPPSSPNYVMTAKAGGVTREAFIQGGWTDANLIANGYMIIQ